MIPEIFVKGGPLIYLIFACSIVSAGVFIERLYNYRKANIKLVPFMDEIRYKLVKRQFDDSLSLCNNTPGPIAAVLRSGISKYTEGRARVKEAMEENVTHEIARLEKNVPIMATISHVTPLLGLLGTVLGMIEAFMVIQAKGGVVNPSDLAGGISEALITTAAGLAVAIPSYIAYSYLANRVSTFIMNIDEASTEVLDLIETHTTQTK